VAGHPPNQRSPTRAGRLALKPTTHLRYGACERGGQAEKQVWAWDWMRARRVRWVEFRAGLPRVRAERERWLAVPGAWSGGGLGGRCAMQVRWGIGGTDGLAFYLYRISTSHSSAVLVLLGLVERAELESGGVDVRIGFSAWYQPQPQPRRPHPSLNDEVIGRTVVVKIIIVIVMLLCQLLPGVLTLGPKSTLRMSNFLL
jgi:hypothetical protein